MMQRVENRSGASSGRQACLQVRHEILETLDSHRESDERVADSQRASRLRRKACVGHQGWVFGERLDAPQALGARENAQSTEKRACLGETARDLEADHAAGLL